MGKNRGDIHIHVHLRLARFGLSYYLTLLNFPAVTQKWLKDLKNVLDPSDDI